MKSKDDTLNSDKTATRAADITPAADAENNFKLYLRILAYLRPYIRSIILILLCNFFFVIFDTLSIWMVAPFVSTLFKADQPAVQQTVDQPKPLTKETSILNLNQWLKQRIEKYFRRSDHVETLKLLCLLIFLAFLLKNSFAFAEAWLVSFIEQGVIKDLRDQIYGHVLMQPLSFFSQYQIGNLISRITNDVNAVNVAVNRSFTKIIRDPIVIIIFLIILFNINWSLTLLALIVFPVTGILITKVGQSLKRKSRRVQERIADITTVLEETISGIKIVKAFSMEKYEDDKFRAKTTSHFKAALRQVRLNRLSTPLSETLGIGIMVFVLWFGGQLVLSGKLISSEDFIRFIAVLFSVMAPIKSLGELNNNVQIALASSKRVFKIIDTPNTITDQPHPVVKNSFDREIRYENVYFHYSEKENLVLASINLQIQKNQKIALVGSSGAGKTTLVNLLPRFYDVQQGAIKIDDIDIREISLVSLRKLMGIVTQDVILFNDTVANNIAYGMSNYSREEIKKAAALANADEFIKDLPEGYETLIGERGMRLSGGQRQRISIARAILKNPPILIFDEATSSLDSESERLIQEAIDNLMHERTVFLIAHRLSTIIKSDQIIVLEDGRITDQGTHQELLQRSERYKHLYELQFAV
jgi:subfamily B ATP-binding cassette protein MsbA